MAATPYNLGFTATFEWLNTGAGTQPEPSFELTGADRTMWWNGAQSAHKMCAKKQAKVAQNARVRRICLTVMVISLACILSIDSAAVRLVGCALLALAAHIDAKTDAK